MPVSIGPVIKVDGEKEYRQSMKNIITSTKELDSELKATATSFNKSGKAQATNAQKVDNLKKKIALQKKAISEANDMCEKAAQKYGEDSTEASTYRQKVNLLTAELNRMNQELKNAGGSTLGAKLKDVGEGMKSFAQKGVKVGESLIKSVTAPILGIGAAAYGAWEAIDEGQDTVATMTGATGKDLKSLNDSLSNVYKNSSLDMDTLSKGLGEINTRFGLTGQELEDTTQLFSEFASVNGDDVVSAVDSADKIMKQFGVSTEDTEGYLGLLTKTSQETGVSTSDLQSSLEKNGATLRSMGLDVGESITLMGKMSKAGLDDESALKAMQKAAVNYSKDGEDVAEGMSNLIKGVQDGSVSFEELADVVGTKNALAFQDMAKSGELSLDDLETNLDDYEGVVDDTFTNTQDPISEVKKTFHNLQLAGASLFNTIGKVATPVIQKISQAVSTLVGWWDNLNPKTQELIVKIAGIAAVVGPVIVMISKVVGVLGMLMNPIGLIATAIAGITAGVIYLWNTNEGFRDAVTAIWNGLCTTAKNLWDTITGLFTGKISVADVAAGAWETLKETASNVWSAIKGWFTEKIDLQAIGTTVWEYAKSFAMSAWDAIKNAWSGVAPVVQSIATTAWSYAKSFATSAWDAIKNAWESAPPAVKQIATTAWTYAKSFATSAWDTIKNAWSSAAPVVQEIATTAWTNAKSTAEDCWNAIKGFFEGAAPVVQSIATDAWDAAQQAASDCWDAITGFFSGDFPFPDVAQMAIDAFGAVQDAAESAWDWICSLFGGGGDEDLKTGEVDTSSISGATEEMSRAFEEVDLTISDVDVSSITTANQFVNNSVLSYKRMFDNTKLAFPAVNVTSLVVAKAAVGVAMMTIKTMVNTAKLALPSIGTQSLTTAKAAVSSAANSMKNSISLIRWSLPSIGTSALDSVKTAVSNAVASIKKSMNFTWKLPKIEVPKLPHVDPVFTAKKSSDGKVTGYKLSYDVKWYDKGGVFYDPSVIGVAEKRPEFVGALDDLKDVVKAAMAESGSKQGVTFIQNNTSPKALSRLEIYRQTKNYLNLAMG